MVFTAILGAIVAATAQPHVVATLEGPEFARLGIVAELIERPAGVSDEAFAQRLIDAEGLRPWNGEQENWPATEGRMGTRAVYSSDGPEIIVKYVASDPQTTGQVCRIRLARVGMSEARWNAYRWCASAFGLSLPATPPPPIVGVQH